MPLIQSIDDLLGGVSQLAAHRRKPNELEESLNALHSPSHGYSKRPNADHIAKLSSNPSSFVRPDIFLLDYGQGDKFYAAFINGDLQVWDENGVGQSVNFPNGKTYLGQSLGALKESFDLFTDTEGLALSAHNAGVPWTSLNAVVEASIRSNRVRVSRVQDGVSWYRYGFAPPTANYTVFASMLHESDSSEFSEVYARIPVGALGGYVVRLASTPTNATVSIRRVSAAGAQTLLGSNYTGSPVIADITQKLSIRVTGTTIEALLNDVVVITQTDATYSAAGNPGLGGQQAAFGLGADVFIDNFTVQYNEDSPENERLIRVAVMGNRTFVANRTVKVLRDSTQKAPVPTPTALIYIEQADYGTKYTITLDGLLASHETPSGIDPSSRRLIATEVIAAELMASLVATFPSFTFAQFGSIIRVRRTDGEEFRISATDGLADNGAKVLKRAVQRASDLPLRCIEDFILEVAGDPEQAKDNYWVKFDVTSADDYRGVWKECARPGEGIAFNPTTLPHELVFSDESAATMEAKGFPPLPVVELVIPTVITGHWSEQQNDGGLVYDGSSYAGQTNLPDLWDHNKDYFMQLASANGGPVKLLLPYAVQTQTMTATENLTITVDYNDGAASVNWVTASAKSFSPGHFEKDQLWEIDIPANMGANYDIRIRATYEGGATPANPGRMRLYPFLLRPPKYYVYAARDLTWGTDTIYPKGAAWTVTAAALPANYTQTADMTGAALAAAIEPLVEALAGVNSSVVTNAKGTAIRITSTSNTPVTVAVAAVFSNLTRFWNPDLELGVADDALVGRTVKNLSDGSSGTITANYAHGLTVGSLTGGVENKFRDGDLCVITTSAKQLTFRQVEWTPREAGDSITNPWPSFRDNHIRDLFVHRGRLGMLSGGNILFSEAGKPENFFRTATTQLLDADPIDTSWAGGRNARWNAAVTWNEELVVFGDSVQVVPRGEPVFSPATVKLDFLSAYPADPQAKPEVAGRFIFFGRPTTNKTLVHALGIAPRTQVAEAKPITENLPTYLSGDPLFMAADSSYGYLLTVCNGDRKKLYHLTYNMEDDAAPLLSWGTWTFKGEIMGMDVSDGVVALLMKYSDGLYLESLDLSGEGTILVDRKKAFASGTGVFAGGNTTWTLPYSVATDGSEGTVQVVQANGTVISTTRPLATTVQAVGDFSATAVSIGLQYTLTGTLSTLFVRRGEAQDALTAGRTQVARLKVFYDDPSTFTVSVTPRGRATRTYSAASAGADGELSLPVGTRNSYATIVISNALPVPTRISGLEWEGTNYTRSQRA